MVIPSDAMAPDGGAPPGSESPGLPTAGSSDAGGEGRSGSEPPASIRIPDAEILDTVVKLQQREASLLRQVHTLNVQIESREEEWIDEAIASLRTSGTTLAQAAKEELLHGDLDSALAEQAEMLRVLTKQVNALESTSSTTIRDRLAARHIEDDYHTLQEQSEEALRKYESFRPDYNSQAAKNARCWKDIESVDVDIRGELENLAAMKENYAQQMSQIARTVESMSHKVNEKIVENRMQAAVARADALHASVATFCGPAAQAALETKIKARLDGVKETWTPSIQAKLAETAKQSELHTQSARIEAHVRKAEAHRAKRRAQMRREDLHAGREYLEKFKFDLSCLSNRYKGVYHEAMASTVPHKSRDPVHPIKPRLGLLIDTAFETELEHEYATGNVLERYASKQNVLERYAGISTKFNSEYIARESAADAVAANIKVDTLKRLLKITELEDSTSKLAGAMTPAARLLRQGSARSQGGS